MDDPEERTDAVTARFKQRRLFVQVAAGLGTGVPFYLGFFVGMAPTLLFGALCLAASWLALRGLDDEEMRSFMGAEPSTWLRVFRWGAVVYGALGGLLALMASG